MPDVTVVFWRDIPAQVIVGKGRRGSKVQLTERFEQAIDRCAMKVGARDTDSYLAEWRKAAPYEVEGDPDQIARAEADRLEAEYDTARLKALIVRAGLPVRGPVLDAGDNALAYIEHMRLDKKAEAGDIKFVVIDPPGQARTQGAPDAVVRQVIDACCA